jgi:ComF family protein
LQRPPHFESTTAAAHYAFPLDRLLQAFKYGRELALAELFANQLANAVQSRRPAVDLIVPVPLERARLRERGFNQAHEIARRLGARLALEVRPEAARRIKRTAPQADLSLEARADNVRGAFAADAQVMGRRIAVVDDVMTTGATLNEFAGTLKAYGAIHVENWIVARALLAR